MTSCCLLVHCQTYIYQSIIYEQELFTGYLTGWNACYEFCLFIIVVMTSLSCCTSLLLLQTCLTVWLLVICDQLRGRMPVPWHNAHQIACYSPRILQTPSQNHRSWSWSQLPARAMSALWLQRSFQSAATRSPSADYYLIASPKCHRPHCPSICWRPSSHSILPEALWGSTWTCCCCSKLRYCCLQAMVSNQGSMDGSGGQM